MLVFDVQIFRVDDRNSQMIVENIDFSSWPHRILNGARMLAVEFKYKRWAYAYRLLICLSFASTFSEQANRW